MLGLEPVQLLKHFRVILRRDSCCCVLWIFDNYSTDHGLLLLLIYFLLEFWEIISIHFPPFLLNLKQISLLLLVIDISLPLLFLDLLQGILDLFNLFLRSGHTSNQVLIDILSYYLILYFCYLLQPFDLLDELIDLRIDGRDGVLQPFYPDIAFIVFLLALKCSYGTFVHLYLFVSVLQLSL